MAKFFVGQLVRVARASKSRNVGKVVTIVEFRDIPKGTICTNGNIVSRNCNCIITMPNTPGVTGSCHTDQLEPIVDDGSIPCGMSYEEMMQEFKEKVS